MDSKTKLVFTLAKIVDKNMFGGKTCSDMVRRAQVFLLSIIPVCHQASKNNRHGIARQKTRIPRARCGTLASGKIEAQYSSYTTF
jgi:hypothetical protein